MKTRHNGKTHHVAALALSLSINSLYANSQAAEGAIEGDALFNELLQELEQVTQIATHTKLNIDFVPGMVTVLHGEDLIDQGIHSVTQALATVPGIEISLSNEGQTNYVMRGIGKSFSSGKIKMLVNGRAQNAALSAASTAALFPVHVIDRIEIIRGPGSAIYGEYAYAGVVNIILRKNSQVFYANKQINEHTLGFSWSNFDSNSPFKLSLNTTAYSKRGDSITTEGDLLSQITTPAVFSSISNAPGPSNEAEQNFTSSLQLNYKNASWDSAFIYQNVGDYFGYANALPSEVKPIRTVISATSDLDLELINTSTMGLKASGGARYYSLRGGLHEFFPAGFPDAGLGPGNFFPEPVYGSPNYTEYEGRGNLEISYRGLKNHDILLGLHGALVLQGDTWARRNHNTLVNGLEYISLRDFRGIDNWLTENNHRMLASAYAQDQWQIWKPFTLTVGGRMDHYFDIGTSVNPRVAGVYNFLDNHIFKLQYAHAFRPPTFIEMFAQNNTIAQGNPDINSETIDSIEVGYIFDNASTKLRTTAFYTIMNELITNDDATGKYQNLDAVKTEGAEVELAQKLIHGLSFIANGTYIRVRDKNTGESLPNIANLLGYANIKYSPVNYIDISLSANFVGERQREQGDTRDNMKPTQVLNTTISSHDFLLNNLSLHMGISNLLDQDIRHPAPMVKFATQDLPAYANDYPRAGREFWLHISYEL